MTSESARSVSETEEFPLSEAQQRERNLARFNMYGTDDEIARDILDHKWLIGGLTVFVMLASALVILVMENMPTPPPLP